MKRLLPGLILTLTAFFTASVSAQGAVSYEQFEECVAVTSWLMNGKDTQHLESKKRVEIPDGWKVVGTNIVKDKTPIFFICR